MLKEKKKFYKFMCPFLFVFLGSLLLLIGFLHSKKKVFYQVETSIHQDYQVVLKPNPFYIQGKKQAYPTSAITAFNFEFMDQFKGSKKLSIFYQQTIKGTLIGNFTTKDGESKEIWKQNFLLEKQQKKVKQKTLSLHSSTSIDFNDYRQLIKQYEKMYGISLDAVLKIKFEVMYQIFPKQKGKDLMIKDKIEVTIPLTEKVTEVSQKSSPKKEKTLINSTNQQQTSLLFLFGIFFLLIALLFLLLNVKNRKQKSGMQKKINRFLKDYQELIVTVKNQPDFHLIQTLFLDNFDDLLDIALQNRLHIIYYKDSKDHKIYFYIYTPSIVYVYQISNSVL